MEQESNSLQDKENDNTSYLPNKVTLILRVMVGGYLVYTAWSLKDSFQTHTGTELAFFIIFAVLFALIGAFLLIVSGYALYKGKYAGGTMDRPEMPQAEQETGENTQVQSKQTGAQEPFRQEES